jgi:hypothetical protein
MASQPAGGACAWACAPSGTGQRSNKSWVPPQIAKRAGTKRNPLELLDAAVTVPFRLWASVTLHEHPDRLFDHILGRDGQAFAPHYAASLCLCIGLQLASSLIILCAPRVVCEPVSAAECG